jgi:TRAP-type C4-dicarboxylate transport system permease small subunit
MQVEKDMSYAATISQFDKGLTKVTKWLQMIGLVFLALLMFLTAADVLLRYAFNRPILGSIELTQAWMVISISFSIGYTAILKEHVLVDLFVLKLPPRGRDIAACITTFVAFVFYALVAWRSVLQILISFKAKTVSSAIHLPEWVFIIFILVGFIILALVTLLHFLQYLGKWTGKWTQ